MEVNIKKRGFDDSQSQYIFPTTSRDTHYSSHTDFDVSVTEYFKPQAESHIIKYLKQTKTKTDFDVLITPDFKPQAETHYFLGILHQLSVSGKSPYEIKIIQVQHEH